MNHRGLGYEAPARSPRGLRRFLPPVPPLALDQVQGAYIAWILKEALAGGWRALLGQGS